MLGIKLPDSVTFLSLITMSITLIRMDSNILCKIFFFIMIVHLFPQFWGISSSGNGVAALWSTINLY